MGEMEQESELRSLFEALYPPLVRRLTLVVGDSAAAEDAAAEAFARMLASWSKVRRYDDPAGWLRTVSLRIALRARSRRVRGHQSPEGAHEGDLAAAEDVRAAVRKLPKMQRAAIVLHYFDSLTLTEIGSTLGCSPKTAGVHLHRARERLRTELREVDVDVPR